MLGQSPLLHTGPALPGGATFFAPPSRMAVTQLADQSRAQRIPRQHTRMLDGLQYLPVCFTPKGLDQN
jgi:hypothetical protein